MTVANSKINMSAAPGSGYKYRDPNIPAPNTAEKVNGKTVRKVTLEVEEVDREVAPGVTVHMWTFNGQNMAPILRGKVGDVLKLHSSITARWATRWTSTRAWSPR